MSKGLVIDHIVFRIYTIQYIKSKGKTLSLIKEDAVHSRIIDLHKPLQYM